MIVDLETQFAEWADPAVDLYPAALHDEIDAINAEIVGSLATATYAAMAATTQAALRRGRRPRVRRARPLRAAPRRAALPGRRRRSPTPTCSSTCSSCASTRWRCRSVGSPASGSSTTPTCGRTRATCTSGRRSATTTDFDHVVRGTFVHRRRDPHAPRSCPRCPTSTGTRRTAATRSARSPQRQELGEAELVAVGVAEVEVALTPGRVGRRHLGHVAVRQRTRRTSRRRRRPRRSPGPRSPAPARARGRAAR